MELKKARRELCRILDECRHCPDLVEKPATMDDGDLTVIGYKVGYQTEKQRLEYCKMNCSHFLKLQEQKDIIERLEGERRNSRLMEPWQEEAIGAERDEWIAILHDIRKTLGLEFRRADQLLRQLDNRKDVINLRDVWEKEKEKRLGVLV